MGWLPAFGFRLPRRERLADFRRKFSGTNVFESRMSIYPELPRSPQLTRRQIATLDSKG